MDYKEVLVSGRFQEIKERLRLKYQGKCQLCHSDSRLLHTHHLTYDNLGNESDSELIIVCDLCHALIHNQLDGHWFAVKTDKWIFHPKLEKLIKKYDSEILEVRRLDKLESEKVYDLSGKEIQSREYKKNKEKIKSGLGSRAAWKKLTEKQKTELGREFKLSLNELYLAFLIDFRSKIVDKISSLLQVVVYQQISRKKQRK